MHWIPIPFWMQFKVLIFTYKDLNGLWPDYLKCLLLLLLLPYNLAWERRSFTEAPLSVPSGIHNIWQGHFCSCPHLWNSLERSALLSRLAFRKAVKAAAFNQDFKPSEILCCGFGCLLLLMLEFTTNGPLELDLSLLSVWTFHRHHTK